MDAGLTAFLEISAALGSDRRQVQGPGGNTSLKLGPDLMLVKASGFELAHARTVPMFTEVNPAAIREALRRGREDPLDGAAAAGSLRPSIETTFHAQMPQRAVIHTHAIPVVAAACRLDAPVFLADRLRGIDWVFIEYARPGTPLGRQVAKALDRTPGASVLILQNHGIVVGADDPAEARDMLLEVTARLECSPRCDVPRANPEVLAREAKDAGVDLPTDPDIHALALDPDRAELVARGTLYPDHVVFLGSAAGRWRERPEAAKGPLRPRLWLVPGAGVLLEPGLPPAAQALARCLADVVALLPEADACRFLSRQDETDILAMDEEKYRQALATRTG